MENFSHHDKISITVNENCAIVLPDDLLQQLLQPHRLSFYCFAYIDKGSATYTADMKDITISDGELVFGLPNQIFVNPPKDKASLDYKVGFDENTLALLPQSYPFLMNPLNTNKIKFDADARERVKAIFGILFQLLHSPGKPTNTDIILAHLNSLLTEFNSAYFADEQPDAISNPKLSKYIAFKLAVEANLTEQHDVHTIAEKLAMTTSSLYGIVKDFSGLSPKEWITSRLILEAQRKLQYSHLSVKELAYELGFNDPHYFSRLFKKTTGKSVSTFLAELRDLSSN